MVEALQYHLRELGVTFRFDETVVGVELHGGGAVTDARERQADPVRRGVLRRRPAGRDRRARPATWPGSRPTTAGGSWSTSTFQTAVPHIYAVGDVIGFPSLAATSMEQGRLAACCALGEKCGSMSEHLPIGVYTIPEISFVGKTEEELTQERVPYEIGISRWRELARGQIIGDANGLLKLLVSADDRRLLGVHAFGTGATELIHIGQAVMAFARHRRLPGRGGVQLPDAGRVVQGRGARRAEQAPAPAPRHRLVGPARTSAQEGRTGSRAATCSAAASPEAMQSGRPTPR